MDKSMEHDREPRFGVEGLRFEGRWMYCYRLGGISGSYVYCNLAYSTGYFHGMTGPVPSKEVVFRVTPRGVVSHKRPCRHICHISEDEIIIIRIPTDLA